MEIWKSYIILGRTSISLFAAYSTAMGFFLFSYHQAISALNVVAAVFFLSCGASALNQFQERLIDAMMERTRKRPLPSGIIRPWQALIFSLVTMSIGLVLLWSVGGQIAAILGIAAIIWYNGLYTYLKRVTAFASILGAAVGMIPPAIGWVSAGGSILDTRLAAVCFVFFMWQIPHFWLLVLNHGEEYKHAGLSSLTSILGKPQIARITFIWIAAAAFASFILPLYGSVRSPFVAFSFFPLAAWLIWNERSLTGIHPSLPSSPILFRKINIYQFIIMSLLSADNILVHLS
jgi:protoheme IX farnesyltransferase